ncbi:MAG: hypothetical protein EBU90_27750 [Proteobacteria bacterium]|nr:hypothetical protein [Pseudomonadota bacterium]
MKLIPISQKGKNRIHEGLTTDVVILEQRDFVCSLNGPGVLIAPASDPSPNSKFSRWISLTNDKNFVVKD